MDIYTQVTLEHDSMLPEDRSVNTFAATILIGDEAAGLTAWHAALATFYTAVDGELSASLSTIGTVKSYNLADPEPRVPVKTTTLTVTPGSTSAPAEIALCVSFQAVKVAGLAQARRRGRIYLGPLSNGAIDTATGRPQSGTIAAVVTAADALVTASKAAANWKWCVRSTVNNNCVEVDNGWVDNAFDTQRRRGIRPTSRSLFS